MRKGHLVVAITLAALCCSSDLRAEPIPLSAFFNQPSFSSPRLSPAGDKVAYIALVGEHQIIGVRDFGEAKPALIGRNSDLEYRWRWLNWANDKRLLVSAETLYRSPTVVTKTRYRATRLMGIDIDGKNDIILGRKWPIAGFSPVQYQDRIAHLLPDQPKHVLMQIRQLDDRFAALHRMDVRTGSIRQIAPGKTGVMSYSVDGNGDARAGTGILDGFVARSSAGDSWTNINFVRAQDKELEIGFAGFSPDPDLIWVWDTVDDYSAIRQMRISRKTFVGDPLTAPGYDIAGVIDHPITKVVIGFVYEAAAPKYVFIDPESEALYRPIMNALPGKQTNMVSMDRSGNRAIFKNSGDNLAPHYYLYDRSGEKPKLSLIGRQYPQLSDQTLAASRAFFYPASDGVDIHGFLTVPRGMAEKNLPLVVLPHGGPVARDTLTYDSEVQFLASRGYAVFRMNFRGSYGYGRPFRDSAFKDWGGRMQDDITDGVRYLINQGIADPKRIAIFGSSYGGYAALMGGIKTPELYRAVASYAGVTHLRWTEGESAEGLRRFGRVFDELDRKQLAALSPALSAQMIQVPVLLGHGEFDDRVNVRHSRRMAEALDSAGKTVEYLEFEDEIHGFLLQNNRLRWYAALESFLAEHLN